MKMSSAFPSLYLRADDLPAGQETQVVMDRVDMEDVAGNGKSGDEKPVLRFLERSKGLVLNKTNNAAIVDEYGDESEAWHGKPVVLYTSTTPFQGRIVPCLRVKVPAAPAGATVPEEIPF